VLRANRSNLIGVIPAQGTATRHPLHSIFTLQTPLPKTGTLLWQCGQIVTMVLRSLLEGGTPAATFLISEGAAYGITYGMLALCAIVACLAMPFIYKGMTKEGQDFWYSARGSQRWISLGLSYFASSMGAWVIFAAPEVGILSGWWGLLGYALASSVPLLALCILGPLIRRRFEDGFCLSDWVLERFGRVMQVYVAIVSVFYMWIYLVAELTSMGNLVRDFAGLNPLAALVPLSLVTMCYTMAAGLPASIWTDRLQGVVMVIIIAVVIIPIFSSLSIRNENWHQASFWNDKGFESMVTLILAILGAALFDMGAWQRVYAAKDDGQLRKGLIFGAVLIFWAMFLFGLLGMLAEAQDLGRSPPTLTIKALAFFDLLRSQAGWVPTLAYALATCMVASSVDSLQTGLLSVVSRAIMDLDISPAKRMGLGQLFVLSVNIPAIILSSEATKSPDLGFNIINLFLIADLLTLSITVPVFLGLFPFVTQRGVLAGCACGLLFIMSFGWLEFGTFVAALEMFTLMAFGNTKPPESGLTASRTCIVFFVLPIVTCVGTLLVSWMERVWEKLSVAQQQEPHDASKLAVI